MKNIPLTRASLLLRLRDPHDGLAWREFVDLYAPLVYGYARKQGLQDADAADLSQDVLRAVAVGVGRLEYDPARGAFRNWLFTIVRRRLAKWRASQVGRALDGGNAAQMLLETHPAPDRAEAEWQAEWEQRLFAWVCGRVREEVSDASWQAFWRTAVDGRAGKEVAAELGLTVAAVYHARSRILARLKMLARPAEEP
jgi:RNA polymerase sigma-70 factor (ECF subfamily)